ncbi:hypothetical protein R1sor_005180 [Riccia sorocarpa]|uniref:Uncharacterized protein n=1 Tax=Riccia sorocarpa TaxID=122646 RepID=A0ABD3HMD7_9MARC
MQSLIEEPITHQDESMISLDADDPPWVTLGRGAIITSSRTRRGLIILLLLYHHASTCWDYTYMASSTDYSAYFEMPQSIPIGEEVMVWDRRWIVRPSTLGPLGGRGLFAWEDIIFDETVEDSRLLGVVT